MDLLSGINAVGLVLQGAKNISHELKRPKTEGLSFQQILSQNLGAAQPGKTGSVQNATASNAGGLTLAQTGLDSASFRRLDLDGNGLLSASELRGGLSKPAGTAG